MKGARKRRLVIVIMLLLMILTLPAAGCRQETASGEENITVPEQEAGVPGSFDPALSAAVNKLGMKLFTGLLEEDKEIFISPASIALALAMTYNGARGETRDAMADVLGIEGVDLEKFNEHNQALLYMLQHADPSVKLHIANSLWMREGLQFDPAFVERNEAFYNAAISELDFNSPEAAGTINDWVSGQTAGMIEDLIEPPINPLTILFLINAIYFQGEWSEAFDTEKTREDTFNLPGGETTKVPFMSRSGEMAYYEEDSFQAVRLPYGEKENLAMYVFLPAKNSNMQEFFGIFAEKSWNELSESFHTAEGQLFLPRFSLEYEKSLNDVLAALGMEIAFDPERADFLDMVSWEKGPNLYISEIKHKAVIEVDEKGTEAAAATSVEMRLTSAPAFSFNMKADRPFFFLIHDRETDVVLFMGTVIDPGRQAG